MNRQAIGSKAQEGLLVDQSHGRHSYHRVIDGRKQPIRGLYTQNGAFIARLSIARENGSKIPKWIPLTRPDDLPAESLRHPPFHALALLRGPDLMGPFAALENHCSRAAKVSRPSIPWSLRIQTQADVISTRVKAPGQSCTRSRWPPIGTASRRK